MITGKAKFDALDNTRYPQITPLSLSDYVRASA
jgi:hypothetical protein